MEAVKSEVIAWIVSFVLGGVATYCVAKYRQIAKRERAIEKGLESLLRAEMIHQHEKHIARGYCPIYAKEALKQEYEAYHDLGGNGVVTKLYNDVMTLPEDPPDEK